MKYLEKSTKDKVTYIFVIIAIFKLFNGNLGPRHSIYSFVHYTVCSIIMDDN